MPDDTSGAWRIARRCTKSSPYSRNYVPISDDQDCEHGILNPPVPRMLLEIQFEFPIDVWVGCIGSGGKNTFESLVDRVPPFVWQESFEEVQAKKEEGTQCQEDRSLPYRHTNGHGQYVLTTLLHVSPDLACGRCPPASVAPLITRCILGLGKNWYAPSA